MLCNDTMKTIDEIRRDNLLLAIEIAGSSVKLSELAGISSAYISQIKSRTPESKTGKPKAMGDAVARKIENGIGKPPGWMDAISTNELIRAHHPEDELSEDAVLIPESKISFAAGNGRIASYELLEDQEPASYRLSWFQKYGINPEKVRRFRVSGDSMEPMLYHRDTILVNTEETNIIDNKLYAIRYGDDLRVKYLIKKLDGTIVLRSVNPLYKDEEVPPNLAAEQISIIGRVRDKSGTGGL